MQAFKGRVDVFMMKGLQKKRIPWQTISFFLILFILLIAGSHLFRSLAIKKSNAALLKRNAVEINLGKERENSIDLLVLGDSESYTSLSPLQLWEDKGIPSFTAGQSGQSLAEALRMLHTARERQKPKVVLLETNLFFRSGGYLDDLEGMLTNRAIDYFPIFQFHGLWKGSMRVEDEEAVKKYKGFTIRTVVEAYRKDGKHKKLKKMKGIPWFNRRGIEKIHDLCKEDGIQLMFYSSPSPINYDKRRRKAVREYAKGMGIPYMDLNDDKHQIGIDWQVDTLDGGDHLNISGAEKTTKILEKYLESSGLLRDRRSEPAYKSWNREASIYKREADSEIEKIRGGKSQT